MSKLSVLAASLLVVPVFVFSTVLAAAPGQIEGGDIYRVKNVTKNIDFSDPVSATCNDTLQFKVRIHNPGPSRLDYVTTTATLPSVAAASHTSKMTVASPSADPGETSDTAVVNLDKAGKLVYVAGTTELLDANGAKISTLGDTITSSGVVVTNGVGVSINEKRFVQFQVKVQCEETPPVVKDIQVCELATKRTITIKEDKFDSSKHTRDLTKCAAAPVTPTSTPATPTVLPNTGTGEILGVFAAITVAGAIAHRLVLSGRRG